MYQKPHNAPVITIAIIGLIRFKMRRSCNGIRPTIKAPRIISPTVNNAHPIFHWIRVVIGADSALKPVIATTTGPHGPLTHNG